MPLLGKALFRTLANSMHKNVHRGAHGCLQATGLEPLDSRRVNLSSKLCFGVEKLIYSAWLRHGARICYITKQPNIQCTDTDASTEGNSEDAASRLHINIVVHRRKFITNINYHGNAN